MSNTVKLHRKGVDVLIVLPAPMGEVGQILMELGELGFTAPGLEEATRVTISADLEAADV